MQETLSYDVVVVGSGPGGYAAAFRAADCGLSVALVERCDTLGGVCLNVGCIPSKALLHIAELLNSQQHLSSLGITTKGQIDIHALRKHKDIIIQKLTSGLTQLAKRRKVDVFHAHARFEDANSLSINDPKSSQASQILRFQHCILATGSYPIRLPFLPDDERVFDSTGALELKHTQGKLLVIGAGIIGCEMATVYRALGMNVDVVEMQDRIMPGADQDLIKPCQKILEERGIAFLLNTQVTSVTHNSKALTVHFKDAKGCEHHTEYQAILQSIGRLPNSKDLDLEKAGIACDDKGYIETDPYTLRSSNKCVYAIGDLLAGPGLAHKATAQGRVVAEVIAGKKVHYDVRAIPSVAYTDPEVAWVGITEEEAKAQNIPVKKGVFPWMASGRALCMLQTQGLTKVLSDPKSGRLLGAGITGKHAGDLIAELTFALEMGANIEDIALTTHPHPTLAETVGLACEVSEGTITDL